MGGARRRRREAPAGRTGPWAAASSAGAACLFFPSLSFSFFSSFFSLSSRRRRQRVALRDVERRRRVRIAAGLEARGVEVAPQAARALALVLRVLERRPRCGPRACPRATASSTRAGSSSSCAPRRFAPTSSKAFTMAVLSAAIAVPLLPMSCELRRLDLGAEADGEDVERLLAGCAAASSDAGTRLARSVPSVKTTRVPNLSGWLALPSALSSSSSALTTAPLRFVLGSFGLKVASCWTPALALPAWSVKGTMGWRSALPSKA